MDQPVTLDPDVPIEYTVTDGRAEIVLDRPEKLNAFTLPMLEGLNAALHQATEDDDVYVILLTGNGRGFCSGGDVDSMSGRSDRDTPWDYRAYLGLIQNVVRTLYLGQKPTVAAINGPAVGAGCDFALACDLRVMAEDALLREQFVNIGLVPGDGGGWLLPRLIGESKAKQYLLTGEDIAPETALNDGLVADVVPTDEILAAARNLADRIASKPARAVQATKSLIDVSQSFEEYADRAASAQWACVSDPEHEAAVEAVRNGESPRIDRRT